MNLPRPEPESQVPAAEPSLDASAETMALKGDDQSTGRQAKASPETTGTPNHSGTIAHHSSLPHTAARLENYELLDELGRGGMGVVYRACQKSLNRIVALKMILAGDYAGDEVRRRFLREAAAVARLRHPNIVQVYDLGESDGRVFYSMELVQGSDLHQAPAMTPRRAAEIIEKIARAVQYAHDQGVIHRDLKPANILLDADGTPKISDFGLAKLESVDGPGTLTTDSQLLGTAAYMPPEQARGDHQAVGRASDVYSVGAILFQLLTQQPPFMGKSTFDILERVQHQEPWRPGRLAKGIPSDLETICLKCLQKSPERRYASAELLADDLRAHLDGRSITARRTGWTERGWRWARRSPAAQIGLAITLILAALVGWQTRNYLLFHRPSVSYFNDVVLRDVGPVGLGFVHARHVRARQHSFRVVRRGIRGPVEKISCVDSLGRGVAHKSLASWLEEGETDGLNVAHLTIARDSNGDLAKITALDTSEKTIWSFLFTAPPTTGHYVDPRGYLRAPSGSGAAYMKNSFGDDGQLQEVHFFDRRSQPQPNSLGNYGYRFVGGERETDGLREICFLDAAGKPTSYYGCWKYVISRDSEGKLVDESYRDADGQLILIRSGYARVTYTHDEHGNVIKEEYWGIDGQRASMSGGYSIAQASYDPRGFLLSEKFFDVHEAPTVNSNGVHEIRFERNERGEAIGESYFAVDGSPTASTDGFASIVRTFDIHGRVTEESVFDEKRQPSMDADSSYRSNYLYDEHGNLTEVAEFDAEGKPFVNTRGWHRQISRYDDQQRLIQQNYVDGEGKPACHRDGNCGFRSEFDDRGNLIKTTYLGPTGEPIAISDGYAQAAFTYDDRGNLSGTAYFDARGRPAAIESGWHRSETDHDERGFAIGERYFSSEGELTRHLDGYAQQSVRVDDRGNVLELTFLDPNGKPTNSSLGFSRCLAEYDPRGNLISARFLDTEGGPGLYLGGSSSLLNSEALANLANLGQVARISAEYNVYGKMTRVNLLDADGRPAAISGNVCSMAMTYDPRGNLIELTPFDAFGKPTDALGAAHVVNLYDARGNQLEQRFFDAQNRPVANYEGYHRIVNTYDQRGNRTAFELFDGQGNRTTHVQGHSKSLRVYDTRGNLVEETLLDVKDQPIVAGNDYAIFRAKYDRHGNRTEEAYFDESGEPRVTSHGYHIWRKVYDRGVPIELAYYDPGGRLTEHNGVARIITKYDERRKEIEVCRYNAQGEPAYQGGYFRITTEYDYRSKPIRWDYFDGDGKRVRNHNGYAVYLQEYDFAGRISSSSTLDEHEQPVLREPEKYYRDKVRRDARGNEIQRQYFGVDSKPILLPEGYAEWTAQYDDRGRMRAKQYFDEQGKPLSVRVAVSSADSLSAIGAPAPRTGDIILRVDEKPVTDTASLQWHLESSTEETCKLLADRDGTESECSLPMEAARKIEFQDILPGKDPPTTPGMAR